jgi:hypothetical protein
VLLRPSFAPPCCSALSRACSRPRRRCPSCDHPAAAPAPPPAGHNHLRHFPHNPRNPCNPRNHLRSWPSHVALTLTLGFALRRLLRSSSKFFAVRHLHCEVVTHLLDILVRVCRNFIIIILIVSCFGKSELVRRIQEVSQTRSSYLFTVYSSIRGSYRVSIHILPYMLAISRFSYLLVYIYFL